MQRLRDDGFVVLPTLIPPDALENLHTAAHAQLVMRAGPLELETDLRYPGAPSSPTAAGGHTVRRLLDAYSRDDTFAAWARAPSIRNSMTSYFGEQVQMSLTHHNCLMTKHPLYGSMTGWHRDIRYWSFEREDLVSVWFALGNETVENGALWFVPGSHLATLTDDRFDDSKFFRSDRADNVRLLETAMSPRLSAGDAVLFHCKTLHSAGKNLTSSVKFSLVYSYHAASNAPTFGTRSASREEVDL